MAQMQATAGSRKSLRAWWGVAFASALGALAVAFLLFVHPFLAINVPVKADILVIEGWVPDYVLDRAASEIVRGKYDYVFVSGMQSDDAEPSDSVQVVRYLVAAGIDPARIVAAPTESTIWNKTSHMARAVRDRMVALAVKPRGINVITLGPHARQSLLAYSRMVGPDIPVGVISIPKDDYDPDRWWAYAAGIRKTTKDFAGWAKEVLFGLRS